MKNCRIENCFLEDQPLYLQIGTLINSWYLCFYTQYIITNRNRPYDMHPLMMSKLLINGKIRFYYLIYKRADFFPYHLCRRQKDQ